MIKKATTIKESEWYSLQDMMRGRMFAWCSSIYSIRNIIEKDRKGKNILKAQIMGAGNSIRYKIQGGNIIKFIKLVEAGNVQL